MGTNDRILGTGSKDQGVNALRRARRKIAVKQLLSYGCSVV